MLGAFTFAVKGGPAADIPIISMPDPGVFGVYPGNVYGDGLLHAGLFVAANATTGAPQDLAAFKFGGEVFGNVSISGNIQLFYAGALLTGDASGILLPAAPTSPLAPNFVVGGDVHYLVTAGDIGGAVGNGTITGVPNYDTGFSGQIAGKLASISELTGGFFGTMDVIHNPAVTGLTNATMQQELEYKNTGVFLIGDPGGIGQIFEGDNSYLTNLLPEQLPAPFTNDTAATAQYLGTAQTVDTQGNIIHDRSGNPIYDTEVSGTLQDGLTLNSGTGDPADWYGISVLAGETITVAVSGGSQALILCEVQDPDGRLIQSDGASPGVGLLQFHADRPGVYRLGLVAQAAGADLPYVLTVNGIGNQGFGELAAAGNVSDMGIDSFLTVQNGDFGGIISGGAVISATSGPTAAASTSNGSTGTLAVPQFAASSISVPHGNLSEVTAVDIGGSGTGTTGATTFSDALVLSIPDGVVGLISASGTGAADILALETQFDPGQLAQGNFKTNDQYAHAIGGNIQVINAASTFYGLLGTDAGIGSIKAGNMATNPPSYIDVNADNTGSDGIIDLIDVTGDFGTLNSGGPGIVTNQGGDLRYLVVGGQIYRNAAFGGGINAPIVYAVGAAATLTDDSGNTLVFTPVGPVTTSTTTTTTTAATNASTGVTTPAGTTVSTVATGPQLTITSYGILDKGGQVPVNIASTGGLMISASGANGSEANIGTLSIAGAGGAIGANGTDAFGNSTISQAAPAVANTSTGSTTTGSTTAGSTTTTTTTVNADGSTTTVTVVTSSSGPSNNSSLVLQGPEVINALNVTSINTATLIQNNTSGEIATIAAPGVGQILTKGNLGFTTPRATPAAVLPLAVILDGNTYPFLQQHTGIQISGDAINIDAYGGIGNVVVTGTLQSLIANYGVTERVRGVTAIPGQFNGIVGPIYGGNLLSIDIGEGVLPSGSGAVGLSGIFATGNIGVINNIGNPNGDIRGNIVTNVITGVAIGEVVLNNASIIDSRIYNISDPNLADSSDLFGGTITLPNNGESPFASPYVYNIGSILVTGLGGIIGGRIVAANIGPITVTDGGFGILNTTFISVTSGRLAGITASGYGMRNCTVTDGSYLGQVVASGGGQNVSVLTYPIDVRQSDVGAIDPYFGTTPNPDTDLNAALGTSAEQPNISDVTDTGVIQDCAFDGQESFAGLVAQKVRTALTPFKQNTLPASPVPNIPMLGENTFPMQIHFANSVGPIRIFQETDGLEITTGHLMGFFPNSSVSRVGISVAGSINSLVIHGNFGQYITDPGTGNSIPDSYINAGGPSGNIGSLQVYGTLNGNVSANGRIGSILVTHDVEGSITALGQTTGLALGSLHVLGGIRDGSLTLDGSVGSIIVAGTLGTSAGSLTVKGNVNVISVGAYHKLLNSNLALALSVTGRIGSLLVHGKITGSVTTGGDLASLTVNGDGTTGVIVSGNISVGGRLGTARITNGSVGSSIVAANSITNFTITRGSLLAPGIVESQLASVHNFRITGGLQYGLYGSVLAASGLNDNIDISGNLGDGVNAAMVTALTGNTFHIRGTIADHATLAVTGALSLLWVDGDIQTGAVVSAHPLLKQRIKGNNSGSITIV